MVILRNPTALPWQQISQGIYKKLTLRYYRYFVAKFDHDWPTLT